MKVSTIAQAMIVGLVAIAEASPFLDEVSPRSACNGIGDCDKNGCNGNTSGLKCTAGKYKGCPCGYDCGTHSGNCNANGCDGKNGRCTNKYLGCSCVEE